MAANTIADLPPMANHDIPPPEAYYLPPTKYVPNSPMPLLVYRNVLPRPLRAELCQRLIEQNGWAIAGSVWKAHPKRHFHPNNHECYGIIQGSSTVCMGLGTSDTAEPREPDDPDTQKPGLKITLHAGDVIVHPAGTSHENVLWEGDYLYMAFFAGPGPAKWRTENGTKMMDLKRMRQETLAVPIPEDPVLGGEGYLKPLWRDAQERYFDGEASNDT